MKRSTWITSGLVAVLGAAALYWAFSPQPVAVEVAVASVGPFQSTLDEDGKTRLRERHVISAPLSGRLARISLREGDPVEADAVVATLTPAVSPLLDERSARELAARVKTSTANVRLVGARAAQARVQLAQARSELRRSEQLAREGFVSPTKLEADRLGVQGALREVEAAERASEVAEREREQARAALVAARPGSSARGFEVRSPVAGRVLRVPQTSEGMVTLGSPLIEVGDIGQMEIVADLLTTDAPQARPGAPVLIERWGGPGTLQGQVRRVEPSAVTKVSALGVEEQRVKVVIDLTSPREQWASLGDGYRVSVRIVTLAEKAVVQVPTSAVFPLPAEAAAPAASGADATPRAAPRMGVFMIRDGRARTVPVELGARNGAQAWVRQGLKEGDEVIVYPPSTVKEGARVTVRKV